MVYMTKNLDVVETPGGEARSLEPALHAVLRYRRRRGVPEDTSLTESVFDLHDDLQRLCDLLDRTAGYEGHHLPEADNG